MGGAVASAIARALGAGDIHRAEQLVWHALALGAAGALSRYSYCLALAARVSYDYWVAMVKHLPKPMLTPCSYSLAGS